MGGEPPRHDDAAAVLAELQGREVIERAAKARAPQDGIGMAFGPVRPSDTLFGNPGEHGPPHEDAANNGGGITDPPYVAERTHEVLSSSIDA